MDACATIRLLERFALGEARLAVFLAVWDKLTGTEQLVLAVAVRRQEWYPDMQERMYRLSCTEKQELVQWGQELLLWSQGTNIR